MMYTEKINEIQQTVTLKRHHYTCDTCGHESETEDKAQRHWAREHVTASHHDGPDGVQYCIVYLSSRAEVLAYIYALADECSDVDSFVEPGWYAVEITEMHSQAHSTETTGRLLTLAEAKIGLEEAIATIKDTLYAVMSKMEG